MHDRYVVPLIGRAGLGNELFPIARALSIAKRLDRRVLWPTWVQPRIGPLLRRERDLRQYWTIFRAPSAQDVILRAVARQTGSYDVGTADASAILVRGMDGYFAGLEPDATMIRDELVRHARHGRISPRPAAPFIAMHVRLGDFQRSSESEAASPLVRNNQSTPLTWFSSALSEVRSQLPHAPIVVCSDGSDSELAELLSQPGVRRSESRNALDDMILMSRASGIIGSRSTFSAWGAFLGAVPLLVSLGGNAYKPHAEVWEAGHPHDTHEWLDNVAASL